LDAKWKRAGGSGLINVYGQMYSEQQQGIERNAVGGQMGGLSPEERGAASDPAAAAAMLNDIITRSMSNDPNVPLLKDIQQLLGSENLGAGQLRAIERALGLLSDNTDRNDAVALSALQNVVKNTREAEQNHLKTLSTAEKHALTLSRMEKTDEDSIEVLRAQNRETLKLSKINGDMAKDLGLVNKGVGAQTVATDKSRDHLANLVKGQAEQTEAIKDGLKGLVTDLADTMTKGAKQYADAQAKAAKAAADARTKDDDYEPPARTGGSTGSTGGSKTGGKSGGAAGAASYAIGIKEVTEDQLAFIHKGEAVLTTNEAAAFRAGMEQSNALPNQMQDIVKQILGLAQVDRLAAPENLEGVASADLNQVNDAQAPAANLPAQEGDTYNFTIQQTLSGDISPETAERIKRATLEAMIEAMNKTRKK
jgi:hypothetical protein